MLRMIAIVNVHSSADLLAGAAAPIEEPPNHALSMAPAAPVRQARIASGQHALPHGLVNIGRDWVRSFWSAHVSRRQKAHVAAMSDHARSQRQHAIDFTKGVAIGVIIMLLVWVVLG